MKIVFFLICSDGLSDKDRVEEYWPTEILPLLQGKIDLAVVRNRLIEIANTKNGHDNVTVALMHYQVIPKDQMARPLIPPPVKISAPSDRQDIEPETDRRSWFYLLGISVLLGLGGILAYLLSPLVKDVIESLSPPKNKIIQKEKPSQLALETFSPTLSLDVGSFILIDSSDRIELLTSTINRTVKGVVTKGSILKVTKKLYQSEEIWLELKVCSVKTFSNLDLDFYTLLQPQDVGWIEQKK